MACCSIDMPQFSPKPDSSLAECGYLDTLNHSLRVRPLLVSTCLVSTTCFHRLGLTSSKLWIPFRSQTRFCTISICVRHSVGTSKFTIRNNNSSPVEDINVDTVTRSRTTNQSGIATGTLLSLRATKRLKNRSSGKWSDVLESASVGQLTVVGRRSVT